MKVLVTGASGYVGSRLVPRLLKAGHEVTVAGRSLDRLADFAWAEEVTLARFDVTDDQSMARALQGQRAAYYLVHSIDRTDFVERDKEQAEAFARICDEQGLSRIVYLSGLVPDTELSDHLRSRLDVEEVFLQCAVPATVLRAAMVVGAGSTSFELMRRMSDRVPLVPIPTWMRRNLQPVAVDDVVEVLVAAIRGRRRNRHYDLGGDEVLSYQRLLKLYAEVAGQWRPQIVVPLVPQRVVSEIVSVIAGMDRDEVNALVESLSENMVCTEDDVRRDLVPDHAFTGMREAIARSLQGESAATSTSGDPLGEAATDEL